MLIHVDIQVIDLCRQVLYGKFDVVAGLVSMLYLKWSPLDTLAGFYSRYHQSSVNTDSCAVSFHIASLMD